MEGSRLMESHMLEQLVHNGVVVPDPSPAAGLVLTIRGEPVMLTPRQEEMAMAWARKQGTPYVEDRVFVRNFLIDFDGDFSKLFGQERRR